ncbi:CTP synthase (glutamine hydrolyzing) [Candidatus Woesearchaeota archaeon]|nr:CTP synthase (glutamine hydrolyzing) [Candidatus Woesearchaeota archaeon]
MREDDSTISNRPDGSTSNDSPRFIIITGGVLSGLGKGIAGASIGHLLSTRYKVIPIKCDGYLNTDPGTMNPIEHGEVFVLDDGSEVDMDFGHYERYLNCTCTKEQSLTMGKVFTAVQEKERRGDYLGKTVQFIPHVTDLIIEKFKKAAEGSDIAIIEIGGTVGDIENELFIEAARQLAIEVGRKNSLFVHLTYVPYLDNVKELKSKPTQISVKQLLERGISPDMIICRSNRPITDVIKRKISIFCNVSEESVFSGHDLEYTYDLPELLYDQGIIKKLNKYLDLELDPEPKLLWPALISNIRHPENEITIAICGKYTALEDSYASIFEALTHCSAHTKSKINIRMIETTNIKNEEDAKVKLQDVDGMIVPGGFGDRGTEGKIQLIRYARENDIPFLGICLGLQLATIEFARDVCGIEDADSEEFNQYAGSKIIAYLPGQHKGIDMGGTLRLGSYEAHLDSSSKIYDIYGKESIVYERHRHRYEVNPEFHDILKKNGLSLAGFSPDKRLVEFICLEDHPYFVATQAHPELKSKLEKPAPLFLGLAKAAIMHRHAFQKEMQAN